MVERVGVIGAGTMGVSVSADLLLNGMEVVLVDLTSSILEKAEENIRNTVRFAPLAKPSLPKLSEEAIRNGLLLTTDIADISSCSIIVENITEQVEAKKELYRLLEPHCREEAIIGVNTSCIPVTKIGSFTGRPDKVVGIHLMNPVFLKPAVEVITGTHTSADTLRVMMEFLSRLNKKGIVVSDSAGFVTNRISHLFMNEAAFVVYEQVADPAAVDEIFKKCYGHAMGPLETADLIGIDTVVDSLRVLYEYYQDSKFRCCPLLSRMVDAGHLGKKSGRGFYRYAH
jgi:3-hydroxybutyryl-CoA dehydrogenase